MKDGVLIIAQPNDIHAYALKVVLESEFNLHPIVWDNGSMPAHSLMDFILNEDNADFRIEGSTGSVTLNNMRSIWWRRPSKFRIDDSVTDPKVRKFCMSECDHFFKGVMNAIDVPIINNPFNEDLAGHKPFQLMMAQKVGLDIPKTIMSNDVESILNFWKDLDGKCIYKNFTPPSWTFTDTRQLTKEAIKNLPKLRHAPIIVQEKIEKGLDVRVNVIGKTIYAASVKTSVPAAELDWRLDLTAKWEEHILPDKIGEKLISLLNNLGLHYGCVDMRQQPDGTYKFFEVNPSGQFLFVEIHTGQPLLRSLAGLLACPEIKNPNIALQNIA
jgi:glutathione synthase/RimK-type ligase-like ATP-grasp enzyme